MSIQSVCCGESGLEGFWTEGSHPLSLGLMKGLPALSLPRLGLPAKEDTQSHFVPVHITKCIAPPSLLYSLSLSFIFIKAVY